MAPIERFSPSNLRSFDFKEVVKAVCQKHGLIREDLGGDVDGEELTNFTIGLNEEEAVAVACIGNEMIENEEGLEIQLQHIGSEKRPHVLVAPKYIIDEVKEELAKNPQRVR